MIVGDSAETMCMYYEYQREENKKKRENNRMQSTAILLNRKIDFTIHNNGAHLVVTHKNHTVDFWPGTGKFIFRDNNYTGRGVFNLIKKLTKE
jgi:hypothetical protein